MLSNIELPTKDMSEPPPQGINKSDRSFHMDRGKIVCNGCGGHFPNLVLFENHTHNEEDMEVSMETNLPSRKSGPKTVHKTFNQMGEKEMLEALENVPELKGCYYKDGKFVCYLCGRGFANPYILFSHKIIHPPDMKPFHPKTPGIQTQTPKRAKYYCTKNERMKVMIPSYVADGESDDEFDTMDEELSSSSGMPSVTTTVLKIPEPSDPIDEALPITFEQDQEMVQVPWVPFEELKKSKSKACKGKRTYIYKMLGHRKERCTYVNIEKIGKNPENIVVVSPKPPQNQDEKVEKGGKPITTCPVSEKGLVFTDLDEEKMKKVFNTLPGLKKCKITKDKQFQCDRCVRFYENPYLLFSHRLIAHKEILEAEQKTLSTSNDSGQQPKLVFYSLPGLNNCKVIEGEYHCDICPEKYGNPYLLFTHKMSHDTDTSNSTEETDKQADIIEIKENSAFGNIFGSNGLAHCRIDKGRYHCDKCSLMFTNPYLLLNHKLLHETNKSEMVKKNMVQIVKKKGATTSKSMASTCVETATTSQDVEMSDDDSLDAVSEADSTDKCYDCNLCQVQFEDTDSLATHIELHTKQELDEEADITDMGIQKEVDSSYVETESSTDSSDFDEVVRSEPSDVPKDRWRKLIQRTDRIVDIEIDKKSAFGNIFGFNGLANCRIVKGRYHCDMCSLMFANPYLLLNHKLLHKQKAELVKKNSVQIVKKKGATTSKSVPMTSTSVQTATTSQDMDSEMSDDDSLDMLDAVSEADGTDICYECNLCQVQFEDLDGLASHIELHTKQELEEEADITDMETGGKGLSESSTDSAGFSEVTRSEPSDVSKDRWQRLVQVLTGDTTDFSTVAEVKKEAAEVKKEAVEVKKEPVKNYPGETTVVQSESHGSKQRIRIKVELVPAKTNTSEQEPVNSRRVIRIDNSRREIRMDRSSLRVKLPLTFRKPLKRAVVRLERLDIKPNQVCILR